MTTAERMGGCNMSGITRVASVKRRAVCTDRADCGRQFAYLSIFDGAVSDVRSSQPLSALQSQNRLRQTEAHALKSASSAAGPIFD
jgi:hypothetical protein